MKVQSLILFASVALGAVVKREQFSQGQPIDDKGKGAPILGTYSHPLQQMNTEQQMQAEPIAKLTSPTRRT
jgi:hypothetical protein